MPLYRESFIFRIETDEPATFWSGHTDLLLPDDDILPEPTIALGGGELLNIPDLEALINGTAQRLEISLSGVNDETIRLALEEAAQVPGAAVYIGRIRFDEDWQADGAVEWEWSGEGQKLTVGSDDAGGGKRVRTLTLSVAAGEVTRTRAPFAFFTDADQRRDFPDDAIFSHVAGINAGTSRRWGPS
jgi:hypothetical protein